MHKGENMPDSQSQNQNQKLLHLIDKNEPSWMIEKRKTAFESFISQQTPVKFEEISIEHDMKKFSFDGADSSEFVGEEKGILFHNEKEMEEYKKQGLVFMSLKEVINNKLYSKLVSEFLYKKSFNENRFVSLNSAMWNRGVFIHVPKNMEVKKTLKFGFSDNNSTANSAINQNKFQLDRILLIAEENSKITILQSNNENDKDDKGDSKKENRIRIEIVEPFLKEGSNVFYGNIQNFDEQHVNFSFKKTDVEKNAEMTWMDCCFGGSLSISQIYTDLVAQGASTYNWGLFFGRKKQRFGVFLRNAHLSPGTTSDMLTKGVLDEEARSVYRGTVKIAEKSRNSNGYQRQDVLLLSSKAGADAKPNLEIDNNEVRCTHGVTIGQADAEKLFYLMSRGLNRDKAIKKLVEGFYETILRKIHLEELKEEVEKIIIDSLEHTCKHNTKK